MKRTVLLSVFVMVLLVLSSGGRTQGDLSGKKGLMTKVSHDLAVLYDEYKSYRERGGGEAFAHSNPLLPVRDGRVVIDAVASGDASALQSDLQALGMQKAARFGRMVSGELPLDAIDDLATLDSLQFARPAYGSTVVGLVTSQGDAAMRSNDARATFGVDGTGVTVGVVSDSFDRTGAGGGAAADIASDDLPTFPGGVVVLDDSGACFGGPCIDESRAMMQLIHDVAPSASLAFRQGAAGQADMAQGIMDLATLAGADVIVDDLFYFAEPFFQDGMIAQAVDLVKRAGVAYFSSAGNQNRNAYESQFVPSGIPGPISAGVTHDFDPGPGVDNLQRITVPVGAGFIISFQWDEPFFSISGPPGSASDMAICVTDATGAPLVCGLDSNVGRDAIEVIFFGNIGTIDVDGVPGPDTTFNIVIENVFGPNPGFMKYVRFSGPGVTINEFDTASGTLYGHANATGAEAVGAAFYLNTPVFGVDPPVLNGFSSAGPTPILFDTAGNRLANPEIRRKPEIVAPDGTNTTFFGGDIPQDADAFPNFFGTSASAPHAAAVAALMLDAMPTLEPTTLYTALESTAVDMDDPATPGFDVGFDFASGFGFIQADLALTARRCFGEPVTTGCTVNGVPNQPCLGTPGPDVIRGTTGDDVIVGSGDNDTINGGNGKDIICGGEGNDTLNGDNGKDRLFGENGNDTLNGNNGDDVLDGGAGIDTCNGGNGPDTAANCEKVRE
jgi:hypothetical protein